jgi:3,4-dihydroxy 2-butanone 4-phosphate synthase/GTP cyclohydrolase II
MSRPEESIFGIFFMSTKEQNTAQSHSLPTFDSVEEVIDEIRQGRMVVVIDHEDRENEGDLLFASEKATPELINFMATEGRGLICVALESRQCAHLGLSKMVYKSANTSPFETAFMDSVDAAEGITTGISAPDRARTVRLLADPNSSPNDLVKPGHVFPLEADPRGVLGRPGHTESAVDLARAAGLQPSAAICEILNDDGNMSRQDDLIAFSKKHGLKMCSVADIVAYRQRTETLITHERQIKLPTDFGTFDLHEYHSVLDDQTHLALVLGNPGEVDAPIVRLHSECLTGDVFQSRRCDCGSQLHSAMRMIEQEGNGVLLYMRQEGRGIGLSAKLHAYQLQDEGLDTVEANEKLGFVADARDYSISAQMLKHLGLQKIRLITNNPAKVDGLEKNLLEVSERVPLVIDPNAHNEKYLATKKQKLGHIL